LRISFFIDRFLFRYHFLFDDDDDDDVVVVVDDDDIVVNVVLFSHYIGEIMNEKQRERDFFSQSQSVFLFVLMSLLNGNQNQRNQRKKT
jgi:hypothetical protein